MKILIGFYPLYWPLRELTFVADYFRGRPTRVVGVPLHNLQLIPEVPAETQWPDPDDPLPMADWSFALHAQRTASWLTLQQESRFADLVVLPRHVYQASYQSSEGLHTCASDAPQLGCPALVVPAEATEVDNVLLIFDGSWASMLAIRQFCQTLPQLCIRHDANVLCDESVDLTRGDEKAFIDYLKAHFRSVAWHKISQVPPRAVRAALDITPRTLVVSADGLPAVLANLFGTPQAHEAVPTDGGLIAFIGGTTTRLPLTEGWQGLSQTLR